MSDHAPLSDGENQDKRGYLGLTPPVGQLPRRGERAWVDRPEALRQMVQTLLVSHVIAVDAEFTQARTRSSGDPVSTVPRLALLQLAIDGHCFVVDTLRLHDLSPLNELVHNPAIAILLHGAGADIRVMGERGLHVLHYYDLEATCRSIFGQHESSLAAMLQRAFAFYLDKSLQRTDWTRRPLPPAMIAYAARDAEVTLALYHWLHQHYARILKLHEITGQPETVTPWIEPFLRGNSTVSPEMAVTEARSAGIIHNRAQVIADCRAALVSVLHPMRRNRLLRLITDLSLTQLSSDIIPLLHAITSDERSGATRTLGRLNIREAQSAIQALLHDPVQDVRKAAQAALRNLGEPGEPQSQRTTPVIASDGSRRWIIESNTSANQPTTDEDHGWKSRLRSMIDR